MRQINLWQACLGIEHGLEHRETTPLTNQNLYCATNVLSDLTIYINKDTVRNITPVHHTCLSQTFVKTEK